MSDFIDLDPNAWYNEGIEFVLSHGIMNGMSENVFGPDETTSRAMIVTMLWRLDGEPETDADNSFEDVPEDAWYAKAVSWASSNGIVNGYDAYTFGPDDFVTREQLAVMLFRYAAYKALGTAVPEDDVLAKFADADDISGWAEDATAWLVDIGVINGVSETELSPRTDTTRAQVATMLMRFYKLFTEKLEQKDVKNS